MRKQKFQNGEYYHVYNRGVDKRQIFVDDFDYLRFLESMEIFNTNELIESLRRAKQLTAPKALSIDRALGADLVETYCYCLLPNHFHFILKQISDNGVSKFMQKLSQGYTVYFNLKYGRSGSLFQGTFKSKYIKSTSYLDYLSAYVHGNSEIHGVYEFDKWKWSSFKEFLDTGEKLKVFNNLILENYRNMEEYKWYVEKIVEKSKDLKDELRDLVF